MKATRNILITTLFTLVTFVAVLYITGCKNKCGSTTCQNGGACSDNKCICPTGFYGTACQSAWSDPAIGTYNCSRSNCTPLVTGTNSWVSSVTRSSVNGGFTINLSNFDNNSNTTVTGTIDSAIGGVNKIKILPASGTYGVTANGTLENGTITLHFTTAGPGGPGYSCDMTMKKQ